MVKMIRFSTKKTRHYTAPRIAYIRLSWPLKNNYQFLNFNSDYSLFVSFIYEQMMTRNALLRT
jgi:hypothetical protein